MLIREKELCLRNAEAGDCAQLEKHRMELPLSLSGRRG